MKSNQANDNDAKASPIFGRMLFNALDHLESLDIRTATSLQESGWLGSDNVISQGKDISALLIDSQAEGMTRLSVGPGPLAFFEARDGQSRETINLVHGIMLPVYQARLAAAAHFENLSSNHKQSLTPKSLQAIGELMPSVKSADLSIWKGAAIRLFDILNDDWLLNLAALKQCIEIPFDEGLGIHLVKVFRPSIASIDSINLEYWEPQGQQNAIREKIAAIAKSSELNKVLDEYYATFGHLPLLGDLSVGAAVELWRKEKNDASQRITKLIWKWASTKSSPLAQYHACQVFLHNPSLLTADDRQIFWSEIVSITAWQENEDNEATSVNLWHVLSKIAHHYLHSFECLLPGANSSRIAAMSWWLASQLMEALGTVTIRNSADLWKFIQNNASTSAVLWQTSHPIIESSDLGTATALIKSLWIMGVLYQLSNALNAGIADGMEEVHKAQVEGAIRSAILSVVPQRGSEEAVYTFQTGLMETAEAWQTHVSREQSQMIPDMARVVLEIWNDKSIISKLSEMCGEGDDYQAAIANILQIQAYSRAVSVEELFKVISDPSWRERILPTLSDEAIGGVFNSLAEIQAFSQDKWLSHLPHIYALGCEAAAQNPTRQRTLFRLTVMSSIQSDTISAVKRLLMGKSRQKFVADAAILREHLILLQSEAPPWIASRLGPMIGCLS